MEPTRTVSAKRWTALASVVLVAGAALVAVIASGAANAQSEAVPVNTGEPTVSGTPAIGKTLTGTIGAWTNSPDTFDYQWARCAAGGSAPDGSDCAIVSNGTTAYIVQSADSGFRIRFRVRAHSGGDVSGWAASNPTGVVSAAPVNTSDPSISGSAVQGQTLKATTGGWSSPTSITYTYRWVRCGTDGGNPSGSNCPAVSGATSSSYKLDDDDVGHRMRVQVTAKNSAGSTTKASNPTGVVQASTSVGPPKNTKEPEIGGTATQGSTLSANAGSWSGSATITYAYQWVRCGTDGGKSDGSNCASIGGATTTKYALTASDVGHRLRIRVTAKNSQGSATSASNPTATVAASGPALPPGAIKLPNGKYSIPVSSVSLPQRLIVQKIAFVPNPVRSRQTTIQLRVLVTDTRGFYVRDALVFARSTPLLTTPAGEQRSGQDGWATLTMRPKASFPLKRGHNVQFFVRVRKSGDNILAGVSSRRLVQVRTAR